MRLVIIEVLVYSYSLLVHIICGSIWFASNQAHKHTFTFHIYASFIDTHILILTLSRANIYGSKAHNYETETNDFEAEFLRSSPCDQCSTLKTYLS